MAEPVQAMTVREVEIEGKRLPSHTVVWVWGKCEGQARIEYERWRGLVPITALTRYPIESPPLEELRKLDPCFGVPDEAFDVVHADSANDYEIVRCRAHDRRFLRDTRGSIGWYTVLTLLRGDDRGSPEEIWRRYHALDDSLLRLEGRSL
ncbi:MAG: hypothetical protein IPK07_17265 [Deltaproteobacteria bacterium]|nr:hypothetical protein [Deltaproteobacteria bacterium]